MKQDPEFFGEAELDLVYIAKKLREALPLEEAFTAQGIDYAIELDTYTGGLIFRTERTGVFFYVLPEKTEAAKEIIRGLRLKPYEIV
ncbi:hypothetical protein [Bryobacter aggregatus]|uniref:hypothetical protein n=1 Tax=Bryobacter aggregatus TaxID=360054 RepID=UPI0004E11783|nr:hypothetical protein [Bryobacter aggregatus]